MGSHTQVIVDHVWRAIFGNWHASLIGPINGDDGRKVGHFFGYGTIGLLFRAAHGIYPCGPGRWPSGSKIAFYAASAWHRLHLRSRLAR